MRLFVSLHRSFGEWSGLPSFPIAFTFHSTASHLLVTRETTSAIESASFAASSVSVVLLPSLPSVAVVVAATSPAVLALLKGSLFVLRPAELSGLGQCSLGILLCLVPGLYRLAVRD